MGSVEGVRSTRSVWIGEKEVVQLTFDPELVSYRSLLANAQKMECASTVFTHDETQYAAARDAGIGDIVKLNEETAIRDAKQSDQKYYLRNTAFYRHLPLTTGQSVKVNAALTVKDQQAADAFLSPGQLKLFERIRKVVDENPDALNDFTFPDDDSVLAGYQGRLIKALDDLD